MSTATQKLNGKSKAVTSEDLNRQIETLRNDLSALTETMADFGKAKGEEAVFATRSKVADVRDKATEQAQAAQDQTKELQAQANDFIREQPATALGIAAGIGFLVGFMGSRK